MVMSLTDEQMWRWERVMDAIFTCAAHCRQQTQSGPDQEAGLNLLNQAFMAFQRSIQNEGRCGFSLTKAYE